VQGGAGVVGSAAIQLAKWAGAWVVATVRRPEQEEVARQAGADLVLDRNSARVAAEIKAATNGDGVDHIVEVDLTANTELDLACLANGGEVAIYSAHDVEERSSVPIISSMIANAAFRFIYVYSMPANAKKRAIKDITDCLQTNAYHPQIAMVLPLHRIVEGQLAVEAGLVGKILLRVVDG
jgi:NADPH2:quinone reductase